jgi:uncharacterized protein (DUF1778 family)
LILLVFDAFRRKPALNACSGVAAALFRSWLSMSVPRIPPSQSSSTASSDATRPGLRTKTIATRLTPEELQEVESAAERDGKSLAEWLRELALRSARQRLADPIELVLAELMATRFVLLNLFHATALAGMEGKQLLPDSVLKIRDEANVQKLQKARKMLQDFFAQEEDAGEKKA